MNMPEKIRQSSFQVGEPRKELAQEFEVSVVMPCLNEAESVDICVQKALTVLSANQICGEIVVSDNGSTDGSVEIARRAGARVVHQPIPGYGNAYMKGIEEAKGDFILMADSDDTYDFAELPGFINPLREGYDFVIGNRFTGQILPNAMPWSNRYIGNPILSGLLNFFFHTGIGDAHCGMRALTKEAYQKMQLRTGGMEFASEMVINAALARLKIAEVPITYYPRKGSTKLRRFRDGWRHLRFLLLYSPTHLYLWPGILMMVIGFLTLLSLAFGPLQIANFMFGLHWMFASSLLTILGFQLITLGFFARVYSLTSAIDRNPDRILTFFSRTFRMENGIFAGAILFGLGLLNYLYILSEWLNGHLEIPQSVRLAILALTFSIIGVQTIFASFFVSMMVINRRGWAESSSTP